MVFLTNLNLSKNELQNAVIQPLSTAPASAVQGQIYYNTVDLVLYQYDGTQWKQIGTTYVLPAATGSTLGGIIVGDGLSVTATGVISVDGISFDDLTSHPTTIAGYGITDALINGQTVTLGSNSVDVPEATATTPQMDGTAAVGSETAYAKGDHVHPTDTSRAPTSHASTATTYGVGNASNYGHVKLSDSTNGTSSATGGTAATPKAVADALTEAKGAIPAASTTTPAMDGTAAVGTGTTYARADHVHPSDTSKLSLSGGTMTGDLNMGQNQITNLGTAVNDGDAVSLAQMNEQISSSTAFFRGSFASYAALIAVAWQTTDPTAANYVSNNDYAYVADDETHEDEAWRYIYVNESGGQNNGWQAQYRINEAPLTEAQVAALNSGATAAKISAIDTKAPLASPALTGTPTAPTAAAGTNTTQIATTAFVQSALSSAVSKATGTISTSSTSTTVNYSGTLINAYATMGGAIVELDITVAASSVTFSTANAPTATVTCTVVYA